MLKNQVFIAIDLETSGKYPLDAEICEVSLIKFKGDEVLEKFNSLVRPLKRMKEEVIKIHHITNEMVASAPLIEEIIADIHSFIGDLPLLGHNLPFDLGFLSWEFEKAGLSMNKASNYCTSLLSLSLQPKLSSHRLIYLASHYGLEDEPNHRAEQDAITCMKVFNEMVKENEIDSIKKLDQAQGDALKMKSFSVQAHLEEKKYESMIKAVKTKSNFELMYSKGSRKNKWRELEPKGLVLKTKEESFLVACDQGEIQTKRFMLSKILDTRLIEE